MVPGDSERVGRGKRHNARVSISKFVLRPGERGFQEAPIADTVGSSKKSKLFGVDIKNDIDIKPFRFGLFANALNVSA
jgi:hypothetical protein